MHFQRLMPDPGPVDVDVLLASLMLGERAPAQRPYTVANFIASADGHVTLQGRSGALGDDGDRAMFHGLREQADAILAGTGTLRTERYGRIIRDPKRRARRVARGERPEPLACTITRSGKLPTEIPIFAEPEAQIVVFSAAEIELGASAAQVDVIRMNADQLTATNVLARLRDDYGVRSLLCEGGPTLFGELLREGVIDELFLTVAPKLAGGGTSLTIAAGPALPAARELGWSRCFERRGWIVACATWPARSDPDFALVHQEVGRCQRWATRSHRCQP